MAQIHPQQYTRPIADLYERMERFDLNPSYQRGSVWGVERKRNLIHSLVMGLPVGAIFLNSRNVMEPIRVVDGKQRILALSDFAEDRLAVPGMWFHPDEIREEAVSRPLIHYSDLTLPAQRSFGHLVVQTYETWLPIEEQERELFELINFGGVPQGEQDADCETVQTEEARQ
jgi:Protein of unknown function DUF262